MFRLKKKMVDSFNSNDFHPDQKHGRRLKYLKFIIIFGTIFTVLQISDLMLTQHALRNPEIRELNPLYGNDWFVPLKMTMVFLIMYIMYHIPENSHRLAKNAMAGMIFIYVFINMNNLYFLLAS